MSAIASRISSSVSTFSLRACSRSLKIKIYAGKIILRFTIQFVGGKFRFRVRQPRPLFLLPPSPPSSVRNPFRQISSADNSANFALLCSKCVICHVAKKISLHLLSHLHPHMRTKPNAAAEKERVGYQENYSNYPIPFHSSKKGGFVCCAIVSSEHSAAAAAVRKRVRRRRRQLSK